MGWQTKGAERSKALFEFVGWRGMEGSRNVLLVIPSLFDLWLALWLADSGNAVHDFASGAEGVRGSGKMPLAGNDMKRGSKEHVGFLEPGFNLSRKRGIARGQRQDLCLCFVLFRVKNIANS